GTPGHEGLDFADLSLTHSIEFGDLDDPDPLSLQGCVLRSQLCNFIGVPVPGQCADGCGFPAALVSFQNQAAVRFNSRFIGAGNCGNEPACSNRGGVSALLDAQVVTQPTI